MKPQDLIFKKRRDGEGFYLIRGEDEAYFDSWSIGIGWASARPGWAVLIARQQAPSPNYFEVHYALLIEMQSINNGDVLDKTIQLISRYPTRNVFARLDDPMKAFLERFNQTSRRAGRKTLLLQQPPYVETDGSLSYHLNVVLDRLRRESPTLHVSEDSLIRTELLGISREKASAMRDTDYPALASISYALVGLESYSALSAIAKRNRRTQHSDYDPLHRRRSGKR